MVMYRCAALWRLGPHEQACGLSESGTRQRVSVCGRGGGRVRLWPAMEGSLDGNAGNRKESPAKTKQNRISTRRLTDVVVCGVRMACVRMSRPSPILSTPAFSSFPPAITDSADCNNDKRLKHQRPPPPPSSRPPKEKSETPSAVGRARAPCTDQHHGGTVSSPSSRRRHHGRSGVVVLVLAKKFLFPALKRACEPWCACVQTLRWRPAESSSCTSIVLFTGLLVEGRRGRGCV